MESGSGTRQGGVSGAGGRECSHGVRGGFRCTGAEYAEIITEFDCASFEIEGFEAVCETPDAVQVHYVITTAAERPENADLAGTFHVTSTWRNVGGRWKLVFNMDRNVPER